MFRYREGGPKDSPPSERPNIVIVREFPLSVTFGKYRTDTSNVKMLYLITIILLAILAVYYHDRQRDKGLPGVPPGPASYATSLKYPAIASGKSVADIHTIAQVIRPYLQPLRRPRRHHHARRPRSHLRPPRQAEQHLLLPPAPRHGGECASKGLRTLLMPYGQ